MRFEKTSAALASFMKDLTEGKQEVSYSGGTVGEDFVLAPGRVTLIGAPPGAGKTALAMQIAFEALDRHPELSLINANAEMDIQALIKRELSRRSNVAHRTISKGLKALNEAHHQDQHEAVCTAYDAMKPSIKRTMHMQPPFTCEGLAELSLVPPGILIVDYLQKFKPAATDTITGLDEVMTTFRELAMQGWAVLALAATSRSNSRQGGHDPESLSLSSFKGSSGIEYEADAAYILLNKSKNHAPVKEIDMKCVKHRAGPMNRIKLNFHGETMRFDNRSPERHAEFDDYSGPARTPW